ncbi:MAG: hypothetical protein D3925_13055 [Candidatus Electrothrix sp. AR5]|nr:hypothetical protein [Candidatus Electrothrix sp. AR5]
MEKEITAIVFSFIKPEFTNKAVLIYQEAIDYYSELEECKDVQLFRKVNHSNEFMMVTKWRSIDAREEYMKSDFHRKAVERLKPYRESDPIINNFEQYMEIEEK